MHSLCVCVSVVSVCISLAFPSLCVGNRKANSVNSNLMSSLKICLGQKTDSDNQITVGRMLETEITGGILSNDFVSELKAFRHSLRADGGCVHVGVSL